MSYVGFLFSDYVESPVMRYRFGFFYISLIAFGMVVNVLLMVYQSICELIKIFRRWRQKKAVQIQKVLVQESPEKQLIQKKNSFLARPLEILESESSVSISASEISINDSESVNSQSMNQLLLIPPKLRPRQNEQTQLLNLTDFRKQEVQLI